MLHLGKGRALILVRAFEEQGVSMGLWRRQLARFFAQRRERVIFVATTTDADPSDVLLVDDVAGPRITSLRSHAHGFYSTEGTRGLGWAPDAIPTLKNGSTIRMPLLLQFCSPTGGSLRRTSATLSVCKDLMQVGPNLLKKSLAHLLRWTLIGNAISVPVTKWLGSRLADPAVMISVAIVRWQTIKTGLRPRV